MTFHIGSLAILLTLASSSAPPPASGGLWVVGSNNYGQLGLGNTTNYSSPKQVGAATNWVSTGATYLNIQAIDGSGKWWCMGFNHYGCTLPINNSGIASVSSPTQVGALTTWALISPGGRFGGHAIKTDGTLWGFGRNSGGEIGDGTTTSRSSPVQLGALTTWAETEDGNLFSLARKTDGTLWAWGDNSVGQLGLGNTTSYSSPKQVGALTTWAQMSASSQTHWAAVRSDGTLWTCGYNTTGQLGLGNTTSYSSPKQVGALTTWASVGCGSGFTFAVKADGTLWFIGGRGTRGINGLGNTTSYSSPKQVGALTTWSRVDRGFTNNVVAVKTDGTRWVWGRNVEGQLGLGNLTDYSSPVQLGALTTWVPGTGQGMRDAIAALHS